MTTKPDQPEYRTGHGFDVHRFGDGDHIMLGGVKIPFHKSFIAHSDGDVLIHALCDAMLGSVAEGDIGQHFPDNDDRYKNIDSAELLSQVNRIVNDKGYVLSNIDMTIIAQLPKMAPYVNAMRQRLSEIVHIDVDMINIKATTTEGLGFCGREEGIAVHGAVMVKMKNNY